MKTYNPSEAAKKNSPEQQMITDARNIEYDRQFKRTSQEKLNQEEPNPAGVFEAELQSVARAVIEKASDITNKKRKGDISNEEFAADMANTQMMVANLKGFKDKVNANLAAYNTALKNGTLSYGMDQYAEGVLIGLNKGLINLDLDDEGRVKLTGKGTNALEGDFDVNIFDSINVPTPVNRIPPINLLLDPKAKALGLDANGQPQTRVDEQGRKVLDTGDLNDHKQEILEFSQGAIKKAGPNGVRSYLADHMNLPSSEVKELMENINYNDGENSWKNEADSRVFGSLNEYIGGKYQRQRRPHPDQLASNVSNQASEIAAQKDLQLQPDNISSGEQQPQQPQQVQQPQAQQPQIVEEAVVEETITPPSPSDEMPPIQEIIESSEIEESPLTMKAPTAADLIKKYSK